VRPRLGLALAGLALVAAALAVSLLGEGEDESPEEESVREVARRVERIRGLRFERLPEVEVLSADEARRRALALFDRSSSPARQRADAEALKLLGLLRPRDGLRRIVGRIFREEVAGFYDPRADRLSVLEGEIGDELDEIVLAHELVHALEDQRFGLSEVDEAAFVDDRVIARSSLEEGTATVAMTDYALRYLELGASRRQVLGLITELGPGATAADLPPYVEAVLLFPYAAGARLVDRLERRGGWRAVDRVFRRPPTSTEQVIHSEAFARRERPLAVPLRVGPLLPDGWRRVGRAGVGEFDTEQILRLGLGAPAARAAAAGWGGGRAELWRLGPLPARGCPAPCRPRDVLVTSWRWDRGEDAGDFERAARRWLERGLGARRIRGTWVLRGGAAAVRRAGAAVTVAMAPTPTLARRLAGASNR
jgi:hypothetical protein